MPFARDYEGTAGNAVTAASEGADADLGTIVYATGGRVGSTCGRYGGGNALLEEATDSADVFGWSGWMRKAADVDFNRLLVAAVTSADVVQASISIITTSGGQIRIRNESGTNVGTYSTPFPNNTWWGFSWLVNGGATTVDGLAAGQQRLRIYNSSSTLLTTLTGACGTAAYANHWEGILTGGAGTWTLDYDQTAYDDAPVALDSGGGGANTPPVANAGPDQVDVEPFALVTLTSAGSTDTDGVIVSRQWTQISGDVVTLSSATATSPTFTAPARLEGGDPLIFEVEVTDDDSDTDTDTVSITVLPHDLFVRRSGEWLPIRRAGVRRSGAWVT